LLAYAFSLFLRGGSLFAGDGDPGRHIRIGTYILENRSIPRVDLFSHTMQGQDFIPFEWLSEIVFAAANLMAGLTGVAIVTGLLFATGVWLVYVAVHRAGVSAPIAFAFGFLALLLQAIHLHPRPHMFTTAWVAVFSLILLEVRRGGARGWLLCLPVLMVLWVNLHGGFLVGFILLAVFAADALIRWVRDTGSADHQLSLFWLVGVFAACLAVSLLNPAGWKLWPHTTGYLGETYLVDFTQEYKSPDFHDTLIKTFMVTLLAGTVVLGVLRARVEPLGLTLWVVFGAFALHSARNIPLFAVVCVPWLAVWTQAWLLERSNEGSRRASAFADWAEGMQRVDASIPGWIFAIVGTALITQAALTWGKGGNVAFAADVFPVAAVQELQERGFSPPGPVYNEFTWGGYLLYAWPEVPVFIDGQTDFYGEQLTRDYRGIRFLQPGWQELMVQHGVRWVLVPPDAPIAGALGLLDDWAPIYRDDTAIAFVLSAPDDR
jgi:hypothetical protein